MGESADIDETLNILIEHGGDPLACRDDGLTPMDLLLRNKDNRLRKSLKDRTLARLISFPKSSQSKSEIVIFVIEKLDDSRTRKVRTWLLRCLKIMIETGVDFAYKSLKGFTVLETLFAVWEGRELGADPKSNTQRMRRTRMKTLL